MKYALISDVHSNLPALEAVLGTGWALEIPHKELANHLDL